MHKNKCRTSPDVDFIIHKEGNYRTGSPETAFASGALYSPPACERCWLASAWTAAESPGNTQNKYYSTEPDSLCRHLLSKLDWMVDHLTSWISSVCVRLSSRSFYCTFVFLCVKETPWPYLYTHLYMWQYNQAASITKYNLYFFFIF